EIPEPTAGPGEVRIRVHAVAVNPTDTLVRNGSRADAQKEFEPPYVPGMDAAGVLDEIGDGADTDLAIGDEVMAVVVPRGSHGAYSEYIVVPSESVVRTPAGATLVEASTLPMNGLTARQALDRLALQPGQTLAVTGAAGAFGGYVVQLATAEGLRVIADASPADEALVRSLGAEVVARGDGMADTIRELVPEGVDGLADGALLFGQALPAVRDGGGLAVVRTYSGETERGITIHPVWVREYAREQAKLDRLREQVEEGVLTLRVAGTFDADHAGEAHRILEAGGTRGRLVIEL
ncbi:MAG TPA: NADP-dependent oxidoreductase, partial [Ilumatobacteraceae bacterium]|nr:NADP-dependent oxidoreductase [Ilumatobacteraceae bacterium]